MFDIFGFKGTSIFSGGVDFGSRVGGNIKYGPFVGTAMLDFGSKGINSAGEKYVSESYELSLTVGGKYGVGGKNIRTADGWNTPYKVDPMTGIVDPFSGKSIDQMLRNAPWKPELGLIGRDVGLSDAFKEDWKLGISFGTYLVTINGEINVSEVARRFSKYLEFVKGHITQNYNYNDMTQGKTCGNI